jgi:hypothetical protein
MTSIYTLLTSSLSKLSLIIFGFNVQEGVAIEIAEAVVGALKGELAATAVNAPMVPAEVLIHTLVFSSFLAFIVKIQYFI